MGMSNENNFGKPIGSEVHQDRDEHSDDAQSYDQNDPSVCVKEFTDGDVLLGRGKSNATHVGNVRFQGKFQYIYRYFDFRSSK
jgi:hypothetical protein